MSKASTRASGPFTPDDAAMTAIAGWTDCELDPSAGQDTDALTALGIRRAIIPQLPQRPATLSPEPGQDLLATRFVIDAPLRPEPALLYDLHTQGVRGVRFALAADDAHASVQLDDVLRYAEHIVPFNWHIELALGTSHASLIRNEWTLTRLPVAICLSAIIDKIAQRPAADLDIDFMLTLLAMGRTWLKLSGASLPHDEQTSHSLTAFVTAAMAVRSDRIVWGSGASPRGADEPSSGVAHVASALAALKHWMPNDRDREAVLTANPAQLYDF